MKQPGAAAGRDRFPIAAWSTLAATLIGVLLRIVYLDADPYYYAWIGYITDEGRWIETARSLALYGTVGNYGLNLHFWTAPLFELVHYPLFALFGVSFWSSRLISALSGCALLVWVALRLRGRLNPYSLFLGIALLAAQADLVMLSRVAVPETATMLMETIVFLTLVLGIESRRKIVTAAVLTLVGLGVKVTMTPMILVYALIVVALPRCRDTVCAFRHRLADGALYAAVIAAAAALAALGALFSGRVALSNLLAGLPTVRFLPDAQALYRLVSQPFESTISPAWNLMSLAAWIGALTWLASPRGNSDVLPRRLFVGAAIWTVGYCLPMIVLGYFPHRYQVHLLVPLAFMAMFAAESLYSSGIGALRDAHSSRRRGARILAASLVSLPTGVIASPLTVAALAGGGLDPMALRSKLLATALSTALISLSAARLSKAKSLWTFLMTYPFVFAGCWMMWSSMPIDVRFWPESSEFSLSPDWMLVASVALVFWALGALVARRGSALSGRQGVMIAGWAVMVASVLSVAPGYLPPSYTMRQTSRELGTVLDGAGSVTSFAADGLFLENKVPFRAHYRIDPLDNKAEYVVWAFRKGIGSANRRMLSTEYRPVLEFRVGVSPRYRWRTPDPYGSMQPFQSVTVLKRIETSGGARLLGLRPGELLPHPGPDESGRTVEVIQAVERNRADDEQPPALPSQETVEPSIDEQETGQAHDGTDHRSRIDER